MYFQWTYFRKVNFLSPLLSVVVGSPIMLIHFISWYNFHHYLIIIFFLFASLLVLGSRGRTSISARQGVCVGHRGFLESVGLQNSCDYLNELGDNQLPADSYSAWKLHTSACMHAVHHKACALSRKTLWCWVAPTN